ncbi:MAG TPA: hypothetical protein CFH81_04800 [Sulfurovum sp. UBA12169]|nr:MAG TPA: hypothetical protein CFH81_04800 [Sulfurovum sp. UBA12169]
MIFSKSLVAFLFVEGTIGLLFLFSFYFAYMILTRWNFNSPSKLQYTLEKRDYFVSLILYFALSSKVVLLPFFINLLNSLSEKLPGAMCAAGVVSANEYGQILLILKVVIIFVSGTWLILNAKDKLEVNLPYIKSRYYLYLILFFLIILELVVEYLYFTNISTEEVVLCCSAIYGANSGGLTLPFGLDIFGILYLFYATWVLLFLTYIKKYLLINTVANILYLVLSFYALTYFFSTYVYELPTHKCPYCLFQKEYHYIGYLLWGSLIGGSFYAIAGLVVSRLTRFKTDYLYRNSLVLDTIFISVCTLYVVAYYLKNGVFL